MRWIVACAALLAATPAAAQDRQVVQVPGALAGLPFSPAIRTGNLVFLSGQIGNVPGTRTLAEGGIAGQMRQAMENLGVVLRASGSSWGRVVKCTVFLLNIADYDGMNAVYRTYFPTDPPARSTLAASGLALGALVEVECIALVG